MHALKMNVSDTTESEARFKATMPIRDLMILALLLALPSTGFIQKYTGLAGVAGYVTLVALALFLTGRFGACFAPGLRRYYRHLSVLSLAALAIGFAILHPIEDAKGLGKSSDRDDGLNLAVTRMVNGKSPYYPSDKFAGPLSVLPGSVVLAAPFVALGDSGYQNWFWLAAFLYVTCRYFKDKAVAIVMLVGPILLSPAALYEYVSGGDMLANGIYVALFFLLTLKSWSAPDAPGWSKWSTCVMLGIGLASRSNFLLLIPLFTAALWRMAGLRQATVATVCVLLVAAAITIPIYLHDPAGFTPLLAKHKMAIVDQVLPWASKAMIGTTALFGVLAAWAMLRCSSADVIRTFFRWCTLVTLLPMVLAVSLFSGVNGHLDFGFMRDRFGLMYVFFALLGWGGRLLTTSPPGHDPGTKESLL